MRLDLDLASQLVLDAVLLQLALAEHLQRDDVLVLSCPRQVDSAYASALLLES